MSQTQNQHLDYSNRSFEGLEDGTKTYRQYRKGMPSEGSVGVVTHPYHFFGICWYFGKMCL